MKLHHSHSIHQDHQLIMSVAMESAFRVLMMPILELSDWLEKEIEKNPLLKLNKSPSVSIDLSSIKAKKTLYEHLIHEIELHFDTPEEKKIAREIAGSLDEKGFITLSPSELKGKEVVLKKFQRMEPLGLGTHNVREALLIQLEPKTKDLIYQVVALHYDDLLHNRLGKIAKNLKIDVSELKERVQKDLCPLNPFPGRQFGFNSNAYLIPDISIVKERETWHIEVNDSDLPTFEIQESYLKILENLSSKIEEVDFIRRHLAASNWLMRTVRKRRKILYEISIYLLKNQRDYLEGVRANPLPMTMKEVGKALTLSESTMTRAIAHKAIATPLGLIKLRSFFTHPIQKHQEKVSNQEAKDLLIKFIKQEKKPLSDEALSRKMKEQGIRCARRTVAKYRKELKIGSASQRKTWNR